MAVNSKWFKMLKTKHHGKFEKVVKWQRNPPTKSNQTIEIEDLRKLRDTEFFASNIKNDSV